MLFETNNHSVFLLHYHLILSVKYRRKVINDEISLYLKDTFLRLQDKYNIRLEEFHHDKDHVHILFKADPNSELSKFINAYKSASSRLVKRDFPQIKKSLYKEAFWSQSFCLISTGGVTVDIIREYIQSQGEEKVDKRKHRNKKQSN